MIEEVFVFRTFEAASTRLGGVRRWANGDSTNVSGLPGARNGRRLDLNRQPSGGCRLNYAYAVLESELRIKAISDGYDPTIGIMHEGSDGSSKFVFDLMEPERPRVDRVVLEFVKSTVFDPADFVIRSDGVCRLNPEMARAVVARVHVMAGRSGTGRGVVGTGISFCGRLFGPIRADAAPDCVLHELESTLKFKSKRPPGR